MYSDSSINTHTDTGSDSCVFRLIPDCHLHLTEGSTTGCPPPRLCDHPLKHHTTRNCRRIRTPVPLPWQPVNTPCEVCSLTCCLNQSFRFVFSRFEHCHIKKTCHAASYDENTKTVCDHTGSANTCPISILCTASGVLENWLKSRFFCGFMKIHVLASAVTENLHQTKGMSLLHFYFTEEKNLFFDNMTIDPMISERVFSLWLTKSSVAL